MGYVFEDKEIKRSVGVIGMDAIFTPIKKVNYVVENMRVGKRTDFDKLSLEVETDGTITPEEALSQSLDILVSQFQYILENIAVAEKKETKKKK
jgi:DNA-directed RNA polymerase subunit alpha